MENIKIKNYLILLGIFFITFVLCFYLFSWIKLYNEVKMGEPYISDALTEVKYDDLDNFLIEHDFTIIYMGTTAEVHCRNFEKKFSSYLKDNNLTENILYLNLGYNRVENNLLQKIYNKYKHNDLIKKINNYPVIVVFNNGKIIDFLTITKNYDMEDISYFLKGYDIND